MMPQGLCQSPLTRYLKSYQMRYRLCFEATQSGAHLYRPSHFESRLKWEMDTLARAHVGRWLLQQGHLQVPSLIQVIL